MGSNRRKLGAGTPQVGRPAPRRKMDTPEEAIAELRELLAEARGVLSDLVRERKAVEALARTRAEQVIESTVNQCMDELNAHIAETIRITDRETKAYFAGLIDDAVHGPRTARKAGVPSLPEIVAASQVARRFREALTGSDDE